MARKKRKASYRRLDKRERKAIEHALDGRVSCRFTARDLGRSASTIHDEVVRNRVVTKEPGKGENVSGTDGSQAGGLRVCPKLLSWSFCCNGCRYRRLSPQQIPVARAGQIGISKPTIYRWVDEVYGGMIINAELCRKSKEKRAAHRGEGRSYRAFLALP